MAPTTVFRNAAWVVAWDEARAAHVYRCGIDVAIRGTEIVFLGKDFADVADVEVDCTRCLLLPGLVNIHTHPTSEPLRKGITDETRSPGFWHSSLYEYLPVFNNDRDGSVAAMQRGARRAADERRHHRGRPVNPVRRLDRHACRARHPRRGRADVPRRALVHPERPPARIRMGQEGGPRSLRQGAAADRPRQPASLGAAQRHALPGADRHLLARADPRRLRLRRRAATAAADPRLAKRHRVPRDVQRATARRQSPGCTASARWVGRPSSATASSSTIIPGCTGRPAATCAPPARDRRHRRPLPHGVHAPRHRHEHVRRLCPPGRQPRHRHRHLSAQFPGGDAQRLHHLARASRAPSTT